MDAGFLETAAAGLSTAQVILLTIMAMTQRGIDLRLKSVEKKVSKVFTRVQTLSQKAGLGEVEPE